MPEPVPTLPSAAPAKPVRATPKIRPSFSAAKGMLSVRKTFAPFFIRLVGASFFMIAFAVVAEIVIVFLYQSRHSDVRLAFGEKILILHIIRTSLGMLLGLVAIALGVVMSWVAVEAPFRLNANAGSNLGSPTVSLNSIGPGISLMLGGMAMIVASLYAPMWFNVDGKSMTSSSTRPLNSEPSPLGGFPQSDPNSRQAPVEPQ